MIESINTPATTMKHHTILLAIIGTTGSFFLSQCNGGSDNLYVSGQVGDISFETGSKPNTTIAEKEIVTVSYMNEGTQHQLQIIETEPSAMNKYRVGETIQIDSTPAKLAQKSTYSSSELRITTGQ